MEAWADNWFAAYLGESLIVEDSVSITTERSFNAERVVFNADYPLELNFILKDYIENDTGLEYIGESDQQMGDGGFIMQVKENDSGDVIAVSSSDFVCTVIHNAPLDTSCADEASPTVDVAPCDADITEEPEGWKSSDYDTSDWTDTTIHAAADVDPKLGYDDIDWDTSAEFVWGPDLQTNNIVLCKVVIEQL